jgi:hypothetical protein
MDQRMMEIEYGTQEVTARQFAALAERVPPHHGPAAWYPS